MRLAATFSFAVGMVVAGGMAAWAQTGAPAAVEARGSAASGNAQAAPVPPAAAQTAGGQAVSGGRLHGVAKSGNIPLPGVTVTAQNTLTGKRYSTTTDITGAWTLTIPQNGRYVIRTQFAAFAAGAQEALLNAASHDQTVNFDLMLASRAAEQQAQEGAPSEAGLSSAAVQAIQQLAGNGAQSLSLVSSLTEGTETQAGAPTASGAALPSIAGNCGFRRGFRGHQRTVWAGESAGGRGHGPSSRCGGDSASAGAFAGRPGRGLVWRRRRLWRR